MTGPLYSVFYSKCPKCNLSDLYLDNNPWHLSKLGKMKVQCERCGQKFVPETGFYYGAMYVSYALGIMLMFIPAAILYFGFGVSFKILLIYVLGIYVLSFPLIFRWSRNIWLNMFVRYDAGLHDKLLGGQ
jgi:hypothetical protein